MKSRSQAALLLAALSLTLFACGDSEQGANSVQSQATTVKPSGVSGGTAKGPIPPGTSAAAAEQIRTLRERFPPPKADTKEGREAIQAGKEACRGKTPLQVKEELYAGVEAQLDAAQRQLIERIPAFEARAERDLSFAAGQLGAVVYEKTLPEAERTYGFQGCVYELARELEGELEAG